MINWSEEFIQWLQRNNLYEPYIEAHHKVNTGAELYQWLSKKDHIYYFEDAFIWEDSRQGEAFWSGVDDYWLTFANNL